MPAWTKFAKRKEVSFCPHPLLLLTATYTTLGPPVLTVFMADFKVHVCPGLPTLGSEVLGQALPLSALVMQYQQRAGTHF